MERLKHNSEHTTQTRNAEKPIPKKRKVESQNCLKIIVEN
jgi:hypothetical protein